MNELFQGDIEIARDVFHGTNGLMTSNKWQSKPLFGSC